jgi:hypothetical protein
MNLVELDRALRQLRLSGMAAALETRLRQAQTDKLPSTSSPISSPTTCCAARTASSTGGSSRRASAIPTAPSTPSTSISTGS